MRIRTKNKGNHRGCPKLLILLVIRPGLERGTQWSQSSSAVPSCSAELP